MKKDNYPSKNYQHAVMAVDVVIFTIKNGKLLALFIKMGKEPFIGQWAFPGGLVQAKESLDEAVSRHLFSKAGVRDIYLEQLYTFGDVDRDPYGRVISTAYFALIPDAGLKLKTSDEYSDIQWLPVDESLKLAYDHKKILATARERLRAKIEYTNIMYGLMPDEFSLSDLQTAYEIILKKKLDKRNFRKKILALSLLAKTGKTKIGEANRPAELYRFAKKAPQIVEIL